MKLRDERGQSAVFAVVALVGMLGMAALVLDVGAWFRTHRGLQATADAAALAGAQQLPVNAPGARVLALDYAGKNGGGVASGDVTFQTRFLSNDTILIKASRPVPGFFARLFGIDSVNVIARAKARAELPNEARWVAPMVVNEQHPLLAGSGCPCFNQSTSLPFNALGAPGAFGMLNLEGGNGTVGTSEEAMWIEEGFDEYLGLGNYGSDPGAKFSSSLVQDALQSRIGTVLLFPVFRTLTGNGQNAQYLIIGWVGFRLSSFNVHGNSATLNGEFTEFIADGIQSATAPNQPNFGVRTVALVN